MESRGIGVAVVIAIVAIVVVTIVCVGLYVLTRPQPLIKVWNLTVTPNQVAVDENATVSVTVTNVSGNYGFFDVQLMVDGDLAETKSVYIEREQSKIVSFQVARCVPRSYTVKIGDQMGVVIVIAPVFHVSLSMDPNEPSVGDACTIEANVQNSGGAGMAEVHIYARFKGENDPNYWPLDFSSDPYGVAGDWHVKNRIPTNGSYTFVFNTTAIHSGLATLFVKVDSDWAHAGTSIDFTVS